MSYNTLSSAQNGLSRYVQGGTTYSSPYGLGWWSRFIFPSASDDVQFEITIRYVNRADLIAFDMYGISDLEWLVLQYNNILNPKQELINGAMLTLPSNYRVQTQLMSQRVAVTLQPSS
jgi:hypothetical protein